LVLASIELLRAKLAPSPPIRFQGKAAWKSKRRNALSRLADSRAIDVEKSYGQKAAL